MYHAVLAQAADNGWDDVTNVRHVGCDVEQDEERPSCALHTRVLDEGVGHSRGTVAQLRRKVCSTVKFKQETNTLVGHRAQLRCSKHGLSRGRLLSIPSHTWLIDQQA